MDTGDRRRAVGQATTPLASAWAEARADKVNAARGEETTSAEKMGAEGRSLPPGMATVRGRSWQLPRFSIPRPDEQLAARLTLVGLVIALQNLLELPRDPINAALGLKLTGLLLVLGLGSSLVLLFYALAPRPPMWRWLRSRPIQLGVLMLTLVAALVGLRAAGTALAASFAPPDYPNDGTTLDHYAAEQLLRGHDPYASSDIVVAMRFLHQSDASRTTPLRQGVFGARAWTDAPSRAEMRTVFAAEPAGHPQRVLEFESHVSYPALAFLPLVPFVWAGLPSVVLFFVLCFVALAALILQATPAAARPWVALLLLADVPLLNATVAGDLDVLYILLLFVAWRTLPRALPSTVALGLALAAKQLAWFFLPYYAITVWREHGAWAAVRRVAGSAAVFLALNIPFVLSNPRAWLAGVLAPELDPMFPSGLGLVRLATAGWMPLLPSWCYLALELLALLVGVAWYARAGWKRPELAFALAVLPLFFAWRSLATYFYFAALPAFALLLAREREQHEANIPAATASPFRSLALVVDRLCEWARLADHGRRLP
jgi:hypothetical protein